MTFPAIGMQIIPPNISAEVTLLQRMNRAVAGKAIPRAMTRCGLIAHREAIRNAPRGPVQSQLNNSRKTSRRRKAQDRSTGRAKPGGLERSIEWRATGDNAVVFLASNSEAGKYGFRIHEEKGISWSERGPGTIAKGGRADAKFIARAVFDNAGQFRQIIKQEFDKVKL